MCNKGIADPYFYTATMKSVTLKRIFATFIELQAI